MPQTPDQRREYERQWRERNREQQREYRARNQDKIRRQRRAWRERNRDKINTRQRALYAANPDLRFRYNMQSKHGAGPELLTALWEAQDGKCYLCGRDLLIEQACVDHDHSCCPTNKSCAACRRGLVHRRCNSVIGYLGDDPEELRYMATALEAAKLAAIQRIAEQEDSAPSALFKIVD